METQQQGVYELRWGQFVVCIVVLRQIAPEQHNAPWGFFSDQVEQIYQAAKDYTWRQPQAMIMQKLYRYYELEDLIQMPYTYEQFEKEFKQDFFLEHKEEFLQNYSAKEMLQGLQKTDALDELLSELEKTESLRLLRAEERLRGICRVQEGLSAAILLDQLSADELLRELTQKELQVVLEQQMVTEVLVDWQER